MNKTIKITLIFGFIVNVSFAQFNAGSKTVSGTMSWSTTKVDNSGETSTIIIAPSIGYFIIDNIGINVSIRWTKITSLDATTTFLLGGKYFRGNIYGGGNYGYSGGGNSFALIEAGYLYGISDNVFLDCGLDLKLTFGVDALPRTITLGVGVATFF